VRGFLADVSIALWCLAVACKADARPDRREPSSAPAGFVKGQLHVHSNNSGDSDTPPAEVVRYYRERGYDFIVFTDHNRITAGVGDDRMLVLSGVELTQNLRACGPPPTGPWQCLLHVNALGVTGHDLTREAPDSIDRRDRFAFALEVSTELGGIGMLNHPNFHFAADGPLLAELARRGLRLFEVANMSWDSMNDGDATHPSTEALWDQVLSAGQVLYGAATDDAHHYGDSQARQAQGLPVFAGDLGWVMVRGKPERESVLRALAKGDFYSSTGPLLDDILVGPERLDIVVSRPGRYVFRFIGKGGAELRGSSHEVSSRTVISFPRADSRGGYVRVIIQDAMGKKAWTQPVWGP
jgi:hypothetical protein